MGQACARLLTSKSPPPPALSDLQSPRNCTMIIPKTLFSSFKPYAVAVHVLGFGRPMPQDWIIASDILETKAGGLGFRV